MLKNIADDIGVWKRNRSEAKTQDIVHLHNVAFGRRLEHHPLLQMESKLGGHFMGVFGVIEAISEGIRNDFLEFLQLLNHGFYEHVERGCGEHAETGSGVESGAATFLDVSNAGRDVERDSVDRDSDEPHAVVAVESVAEVEVDEGHVADWSNREGFGGG